MSYLETYKEIRETLSKNHEETLKNHGNKIWELEDKIEEILKVKKEIKIDTNVDNLFKEILSDIYISINNSCMSMYRVAHMSLRSSLELSFGMLFFMENKLFFDLWKNSKFELSWTKLTKDPTLIEYLVLKGNQRDKVTNLFQEARKCYSNCSEYLHGRYQYMHCVKNATYSYEETFFTEWYKMTNEILEIIRKIFVFSNVGGRDE